MAGNKRYTVRYEVYAVVYAADAQRADTLMQSTLYAALGAAEAAGVEGAYALQYRHVTTEETPFGEDDAAEEGIEAPE